MSYADTDDDARERLIAMAEEFYDQFEDGEIPG